MTRTEELLALAEAATSPYADDWELKQALLKFDIAANPETIKQLCLRQQKLEELVRLQHEALLTCTVGGYKDIDGDWQPRLSFDAVMKDNAIAAFNKFEGGE